MDYKAKVLEYIDRVYAHSLTTTSGGNLSMRDGGGNIYITPSGKDKGTLEVEDICKVRPDGTREGAFAPSMELPFHSMIYKARPDVKAVVHVHSPNLVAYSLLNAAPATKCAPSFYISSPSVALSLYDIPGSLDLAHRIVPFIAAGNDSVMMQNHGVVVVAESMEKAYDKLERLERCAQICINAAKLGPVKQLSEAQLSAYNDFFSPIASNETVSVGDDTLTRQIAAFSRRSCAHGYFGSDLGAISARCVDGFAVTGAECDRENITSLCFKRDGRFVGPTPDAYAKVAEAIYDAHPEISAVFFAAPPHVMAYAVTGAPIDSRTLPESYIMMRDIVRLPALAELEPNTVARAITPAAPVALIDNSCVIACGESLTKAFDRLEVSDVTAKNYLLAKNLGEPINITDVEIDKIIATFDLPR